MARSTYREATSVSTRTFQSTPPVEESTPKPPKVKKESTKEPREHTKSSTSRLPWIIVIVLVLLSLFLFVQYHDAQNKLHSSQAAATSTKQVNDLLSKVAKLVVVPSGETPTVATVSNANKLKTQAFFANAKNGDKVIVYGKAKEAILYRPSTNQIVTIAPVNSTSN